MTTHQNACGCENCPGTSCACGCQTIASAASATCQCGDACQCGPACTCKDCPHANAQTVERR